MYLLLILYRNVRFDNKDILNVLPVTSERSLKYNSPKAKQKTHMFLIRTLARNLVGEGDFFLSFF